jgi:FkbM family methyltransferase
VLESIHRLGSRIRHSRVLEDQKWLWERVEPSWQRVFDRASRTRGYKTKVNQDEFHLTYEFGASFTPLKFGTYEQTFYDEFVRRIRPGMQVLDIGAHVGLFTLAAAKRVGASGKVYAFEPTPDTADVLDRHVAMNGWRDRVETVRAVVSDAEGTMPFFTYRKSMAASLNRDVIEVLAPEHLEEPAERIDVPSMTLDGFCRSKTIKPAVIKMDVEGAELLVLRGAREVLLEDRPSILCEVHPPQIKMTGGSLEELHSYLDEVGYGLTQLTEPKDLEIFHALLSPRD